MHARTLFVRQIEQHGYIVHAGLAYLRRGVTTWGYEVFAGTVCIHVVVSLVYRQDHMQSQHQAKPYTMLSAPRPPYVTRRLEL